MPIANSWLVNKIIALSVSLRMPYMVKHKVLLDKRRSRSWTLLLVIGSWYCECVSCSNISYTHDDYTQR